MNTPTPDDHVQSKEKTSTDEMRAMRSAILPAP